MQKRGTEASRLRQGSAATMARLWIVKTLTPVRIVESNGDRIVILSEDLYICSWIASVYTPNTRAKEKKIEP